MKKVTDAFKDFTGGHNQWVSVENFKDDVKKIIDRQEVIQ